MAFKRLGKTPVEEIVRLLEEKKPEGIWEQAHQILTTTKRFPNSDLPQKLDDWLDSVLNPPAQPAAPPDDSMERNEAYNRAALALAAKRLQRKQDQQAGLDRLEQYAVEQRLSRVQSNVDAIDQWLQANCKGYWSAGGIDAAVRVLSAQGRLQFDQPTVTPPPPAPARQWKKGDPLPDDASEEQLRASTAEQVKAWLRRKR